MTADDTTEPPSTESAQTLDPASEPPPRLRHMMGRYSGPKDLDGQVRLASLLKGARWTIPWQFRGNQGDILALIQQAVALDVELAVALHHIHFNSDGVGGMSARLMHALVIRAGHRIEVLHADDRRARMRLTRGDGKPGGHAQWTIAEAHTANLVKPDKACPWRSYPGDMLWARCISRVVRRWAPETILGFYEFDELDSIPVDDLDPVDMSTAVSDSDGNLLPAPDVQRLLADLDTADSGQIREQWRVASEAGLLRVFGGTVGGVHHTVEEILFDRGTDAQEREEAERKKTRQQGAPDQIGFDPGSDPGARQPEADVAGNGQDAVQVDGDDAPAGVGTRLACGCNPAAVTTAGRHESGCVL